MVFVAFAVGSHRAALQAQRASPEVVVECSKEATIVGGVVSVAVLNSTAFGSATQGTPCEERKAPAGMSSL